MKSKMRKLISVLVVAFLLFSTIMLAAPTMTQASTSPTPTYYTINEDSSPVFNTLIPDQADVIKDNVGYKLYYAGNDFGSINLATSPMASIGHHMRVILYYRRGRRYRRNMPTLIFIVPAFRVLIAEQIQAI